MFQAFCLSSNQKRFGILPIKSDGLVKVCDRFVQLVHVQFNRSQTNVELRCFGGEIYSLSIVLKRFLIHPLALISISTIVERIGIRFVNPNGCSKVGDSKIVLTHRVEDHPSKAKKY